MGKGKPPRLWRDVSFLQGQPTDLRGQLKSGILEAHISFVICGSDDSRWVGYAFSDDEEEEENLEDEVSSDDVVAWDPIAWNSTVDANVPFWNPKEYFLKIIEVRMVKVLERWKDVVHVIEWNIKEGVCFDFCFQLVLIMGITLLTTEQEKSTIFLAVTALNNHR